MKTLFLLRKEIKESVLSLRGAMWYFLTSVILSVLSYLFLTDKELSLLDQGQMLYMTMNLIVVIGILIGLVIGSDAVAGEIERGTLEALLLAPITRTSIAAAKLLAALANWGCIFLVSLPYLFVMGKGGHDLASLVPYLAILGTLLVLIFSAFSIGLSARTRSVKNALVISFLVFLLSAWPVFLSAAQRKTWFGGALDAVDPVANAVNTFDSVIIDSQSLVYQTGRVTVICVYVLLSLWFLKRSISRLSV